MKGEKGCGGKDRSMGRVQRGWGKRAKRRGKEKRWRDGRRGEGRDFQKFIILTASMLCSANLHHRAKFRAGLSNRCRDMAVFDFSRWRPSDILDLLYACLDHPRSAF